MNAKALTGANRAKTMTRILAHEVTHRFKETAAEAYAAYRDFCASTIAQRGDGNLESLIGQYQQKYAKYGQMDNESALDEIAADYAMTYLADTQAFQAFISEHRTWGEKIADALQAVVKRLRDHSAGRQNVSQEVTEALKLWENAYNQAKEAVKNAPVGGRGDGVAKNSLGELQQILESETDYSYENVNWLFDMSVVTKQQLAIFYEAVAKISKRGYYCPISADGLYIVDLGDVLVFTDADYDDPKIYRAVQFADDYETNIQKYKERIIDEEGRTAGFGETLRIIRSVEGEGFLTEYTSPYGSTNEGKNRTGKRKNSSGTDSKNRGGRNTGGLKRNSVSGSADILRNNQNLDVSTDEEADVYVIFSPESA